MNWWKDFTSVLQSVVTTLGLIGAGIWFFQRREGLPRASLSYNITHKLLNDEKLLLHVVIRIENIGSVLLRPRDGQLRICKVLPLTANVLSKIENREDTAFILSDDSLEIDWSDDIEWTFIEEPKLLLKSVVLEPKESHEIYFDCLLDLPIEVVKIYFSFRNVRGLKTKNDSKKDDLVWSLSVLYEM